MHGDMGRQDRMANRRDLVRHDAAEFEFEGVLEFIACCGRIRECEASYSQYEGGCDQSGAAPSGSRAYRHGVAAGRVLGLHGLFLRWHSRSVRRSDLRLLGIVGSDGGLPDRFSKAGFFLGAAF